MGVYYDFYVEILKDGKWQLLKTDEEMFVRSSYYYDFFNNYCIGSISCFNLSQELIDILKLREKGEKEFEYYYNNSFHLMDIEKMMKNYKDDIHDYDGIISHQDYKKIQNRDIKYPKIISVPEFNKLPNRIKKNYGYYKWDDEISDYAYLYKLVPIINKMIDGLEYEKIRLIVHIC